MIQSLSRRRFLAIIGIGTGIAAAGSVLAHRLGLRVLEGINAQLQLVLEPGLKDAPRGTLGEEAVRTLVATTEALVGRKIKPDHYEAFLSLARRDPERLPKPL